MVHISFGIQILPETLIHAVVIIVHVAVHFRVTALPSQVKVPARRLLPSTTQEDFATF